MASRIEQLIDELDDYIDNCKYQPLSNTKIIVVKDEIVTLINELRKKTPEELAKYQKVVSNQQAILKDAREKADALINEAAAQTSEMINQNSIMKQAYAQADEVVKSAYQQAQEILMAASTEAAALRSNAVEYLDNMLATYENVVTDTLRLTQSHYESFYSQINQYRDVVISNRMELNPPITETAEMPSDIEDTGAINNTGSLGNTAQLGNTGSLSNTGEIGAVTGNINIGNTGNITGAIPKVGTDTSDIKLM